MSYDRLICRLEEVCPVITDGSHYSPKTVLQGEPMVSVKDFTDYGFDFSSCRHISRKDYEGLQRNGCVPQIGDILIGKDGARYFEDIIIYEQPEKPALLSSIAIIRCDRNKIEPRYLYYYFKTSYVKANVRDNYGSGSAIPRIVLKDFRRMEIMVPDLDRQMKIVSILEPLDEKIKLNNQINNHLSDALEAFYRHQFCSSTDPDYYGCLSDISHYSAEKIWVSRLSIDNYFSTENMLPEKAGALPASGLPNIKQTTRCRMGDTLISNIRPYFKKILYNQVEGGCSTDVLCIVPRCSNLSAYTYCSLYADSFFNFMVAGSKGTKMPRGDKQQIMTYAVHIPTEAELEAFNAVAMPALNLINSHRTENIRLAALRDTLLPRLMSGELDVSALDL